MPKKQERKNVVNKYANNRQAVKLVHLFVSKIFIGVSLYRRAAFADLNKEKINFNCAFYFIFRFQCGQL